MIDRRLMWVVPVDGYKTLFARGLPASPNTGCSRMLSSRCSFINFSFPPCAGFVCSDVRPYVELSICLSVCLFAIRPVAAGVASASDRLSSWLFVSQWRACILAAKYSALPWLQIGAKRKN